MHIDYKGTGYGKALETIVKLKIARQKQYADDWRDMKDWELLALIRLKTARLTQNIMEKDRVKDYEKSKDTLIDLANYTLFLLELELEKGELNGDKTKSK